MSRSIMDDVDAERAKPSAVGGLRLEAQVRRTKDEGWKMKDVGWPWLNPLRSSSAKNSTGQAGQGRAEGDNVRL
jgi:hypothetical protein